MNAGVPVLAKGAPYIQITALLWYLAENLRRDEVLHEYLGLEPDQIVASTFEYYPIAKSSAQTGEFQLYGHSPCLAIWDTGAALETVRGERGAVVDLRLFYIFKPRASSTDGPWQQEASHRIKNVAWRICHWLELRADQNGWPGGSVKNADGDYLTLCNEGKIDYVYAERRENFEAPAGHVGFELPLKLQHKYPPYTPPGPVLLDRIDGQFHYEGRITVSPLMESQTSV